MTTPTRRILPVALALLVVVALTWNRTPASGKAADGPVVRADPRQAWLPQVDPDLAEPLPVAATSRTAAEPRPTEAPSAGVSKSAKKIRFAGRVVDRNGEPLPLAEIAVSGRGLLGLEQKVATSDENGEFEFAIEGSNRLITARRSGRGHSLSLPLSSASMDWRHLTLVVDQRSARLGGRVTTKDGAPIGGAIVVVGELDESARLNLMRAPYRDMEGLTLPVHTVTGPAGWYSLGAAPVGGGVPVFVSALGFASWQGTANTATAKLAFLDVELSPGATVHGKVLGSDGAPCAGAIITVETGQGEPDWFTLDAVSSPDGSYLVKGLAAGQVHLTATHPEGGTAQVDLTTSTGEALTWHPTLAPGRQLCGRVVDKHGAPLVGWTVRQTGGRRLAQTTDSEGRFRFSQCGDRTYELRVFQRDAYMPTEVAVVSGVQPDGPDVEIRVSTEALATTYIGGEIRSSAGEACRCVASVRAYTETHSQQMSMALLPGRFCLGPLPPGDYEVGFMVNDHEPLSVERFSLAHGERHSLGVLIASRVASKTTRSR